MRCALYLPVGGAINTLQGRERKLVETSIVTSGHIWKNERNVHLSGRATNHSNPGSH